jgi:hypothetical protein
VSRQPPGERPGRRGEHAVGVLEALRDFYEGRTHTEGRTKGRSTSSGRLAQRSDPRK